MELIAQALAKRKKLKAELDRVETFLAMAYQLQGEGDPAMAKSDAQKIDAPVRQSAPKRAESGVGAETAKAAASIIREVGRPMSTRDLVSLVEAHDIEIGGKDKASTLSARLGNDAKRGDAKLGLRAGKWHLLEWLDEDEEATGTLSDGMRPSLPHTPA